MDNAAVEIATFCAFTLGSNRAILSGVSCRFGRGMTLTSVFRTAYFKMELSEAFKFELKLISCSK